MKLEKMTKEELELLSYKDITHLLLQENGSQNTPTLFKKIVDMLELSDSFYESKIGDYYMMLTTDKRFILLDNGNWDLKDNHKSDKIVKIEEDDEDETELEETQNKSREDSEDENDYDSTDEDAYTDAEEDFKDLVIIDEDELEMEE